MSASSPSPNRTRHPGDRARAVVGLLVAAKSAGARPNETIALERLIARLVDEHLRSHA